MSIPPAPAPHKDPAIDTSRKYIIVGFVDLVVYDVDIGLPPPDYPIQKVDGTGMEAFPEPLRFQQACDNIRARVTCESQIIPSSNPAGYASPRLVTAPNDED
jgi:hypothetical protein